MIIVELDVNALDHGGNSQSEVAKLVEMIAESGLTFEVGPMGTSIEGELQEVMAVVEQCMLKLSRDSNRFVFSLRGDFERGREQRLEKRVEEVVQEVLNSDSSYEDSRSADYEDELNDRYTNSFGHSDRVASYPTATQGLTDDVDLAIDNRENRTLQ